VTEESSNDKNWGMEVESWVKGSRIRKPVPPPMTVEEFPLVRSLCDSWAAC